MPLQRKYSSSFAAIQVKKTTAKNAVQSRGMVLPLNPRQRIVFDTFEIIVVYEENNPLDKREEL